MVLIEQRHLVGHRQPLGSDRGLLGGVSRDQPAAQLLLGAAHLTIEKPYESFHVYTLDWTDKRLDLFVDDQKCLTFENDGKSDNNTWPFSQPFYLKLNTAIGGAWGGQKGIDDSIFPQKFLIDYVRVYQGDEK